MCNYAHLLGEQLSTKLYKSGTGWKMFCTDRGELVPISNDAHSFTIGETYIWDNDKHSNYTINFPDRGFCCFKTKKEAIKVYKCWRRYSDESVVLYKIKYKNPISYHIEKNFVSEFSVRILLVKEFKILEEVLVKHKITKTINQ